MHWYVTPRETLQKGSIMRQFHVIPIDGGFTLERPSGERMHEVWSKSESTMQNAAGTLNRLRREAGPDEPTEFEKGEG